MSNGRNIWYYIRNYKFNSILFKNFVIIMLLIIFPISLITLGVYNNTRKLVEDEITSISVASLYRVRDMVDTILRDATIMATKISLETQVQMFMLSSCPEYYRNNIDNDIYNTTRLFRFIHQYIDSIYVYSEINDYIIANRIGISSEFNSDRNWYNVYQSLENSNPVIITRRKNDIYPYYLTVLYKIYSNKGTRLGAIVVNINIETLGKTIGQHGSRDEDNMYIIDKKTKSIIYSNEREDISRHTSSIPILDKISLEQGEFGTIIKYLGEQYVVSAINSENNRYVFVSLLPLREYNLKLDSMNRFIMFFLLTVVVFTVAVSLVISIRTFQPVKNIMSIIEDPEYWKEEDSSKNSNEIKDIAANIVKTIYSNKQLKKELEQRLVMLNQAHAVALQAQINPHFLYNTLETINWNAIRLTKGKNEVSEMISGLSELLRLSIDNREHIICLSEEISHTRSYIKIMKARYGDRFKVVWDIDNIIVDCKVPKLFLQPLVENAINHGLKPKRFNGVIEILGYKTDTQIIITVIDNGIGMDEKTVDKLNTEMKEQYVFIKEHIGILNVNQRIKLLLGDEYGVTIYSEEGSGTKITVTLPLIQ